MLQFNVDGLEKEVLDQLCYSIYFIDKNIVNTYLKGDKLIIEHSSKNEALIEKKVYELINRYTNNEFAFKKNVIYNNSVETPYSKNIMEILFKNRIIKELDLGIYIFREPFVSILKFLDDYIVKNIANRFNAKHEYYPVVINSETLNKTNHFTSFPEHVEFVTHLKEDLDLIESFIEEIKKANGFNKELELDLNKLMDRPNYMINPATCYHCYEGLQGEILDEEGLVVTAVSKVHRYESKNHRQLGRLLDFTMREIIFVGKPKFVKENRMKSLEIVYNMAKRWDLDFWIENANDMFFTKDYQVKASFQRSNDMKYELKMKIPYLNKSIAVSSSNFHSATFGKAFNIKYGKRPVVTACLAFGLERWVFAFLSQYGLDKNNWPEKFVEDFNSWRDINGISY